MDRGPRRAGGFSLLELVVVVCLIGIFAAVALDRMLRYQEIAEKTAMESQLGAMRSALALQVASRIATGGLRAVAGLAEENPVEWLATAPPGYAGALYDPSIEMVPKGSWYFDLKRRQLVYRPRITRFLSSGKDGSDLLRYEVVVRVKQADPSRRQLGEVSEIGVRALSSQTWAPEF
jgi:prepilin-type N-terminal cleavage/methylation domain-containing protein